jgi:glucuronoarabinoxylan endo-1,4-beta-xylanase
MKPFIFLFLLLAVVPSLCAQSVTVDWNTTYQTIDGFGVSDHSIGMPALSSTQSEFLFSPTNGLGFSFLRIGTSESGACNTPSSSCANDQDPVSDMQAAISYGAKIYATAWTPPAEYKTNGNITCTAGSGRGTLVSAPAQQQAYANYLVNYINSLNTYYRVPVYAFSVQNEPEQCPDYDGSLMTAAQMDTFVASYLGPTFASSLPNVLIALPESDEYENMASQANACMNDANCKQYVSITSWHGYDHLCPTCNASISNPYATSHFWMTEISSGAGYGYQTCADGQWCPGIGDALVWTQYIDDSMVGGATAWMWWWTQQSCTGNPWPCNEGLYGSDNVTVAKRAYAFGQYAKFVRPGMVRIEATHAPQPNVVVTAYKDNSTGAFAIIVQNQGASTINQAFQFSGVTPTSVTAAITSATQNLADYGTYTPSNGTFTASLPAQSIVTFYSSAASTNSSARPNPPSNLSVTVN